MRVTCEERQKMLYESQVSSEDWGEGVIMADSDER